MPIEKLPQVAINYPVEHYPAIPPRPVIPTAQLVKNLMDQLEQLSPYEKQKKKFQLELLRQNLLSNHMNEEIQGYQLDELKRRKELLDLGLDYRKKLLDIGRGNVSDLDQGTQGSPTALPAGSTFKLSMIPKDMATSFGPDTTPPHYHGTQFDTSMGEIARSSSSPLDTIDTEKEAGTALPDLTVPQEDQPLEFAQK